MAFFELNSEITVGAFKFRAVNDVRIERSLHSYEERAYIKLPSRARIVQGRRSNPTMLTTASLFTDGSPVTIKLGYNGVLKTEFEGFVRRRNMAMPLEIECEGYSRLLRLNTFSANLSKGIEVKKVLELACAGTGITVECPISFKMYGRTMTNTDGLKLLDEVKKCSDGVLTIFFIEPKKLWCGLVYTPFLAGTEVYNLPRAGYRLGWNCIKDSGLRERIPNEQVQVFINGMLANGDSVRTKSDELKDARKVQCLINGVKEEGVLRQFANEKANHLNYTGYEGSLTSFLEPYCAPGYTATVIDDRYPERDGRYVVESVTTTFGVNGARRKVELGPKVGGK